MKPYTAMVRSITLGASVIALGLNNLLRRGRLDGVGVVSYSGFREDRAILRLVSKLIQCLKIFSN